MREINFRAWDEQHKIMHNDFQFIKSGDEGSDWVVFVSDKQKLSDKPYPFENPYFQQQLKIMQFTGLKDKNGKEIFEGDLIYLSGIGIIEVTFPFLDLYEASYENDIGRIIGNIYETPITS